MNIEVKILYDSLIEHIVPIIAVLTSITAAIIAISSRRVAGKALDIAKKTYEERQASFELYLIDGFRWNNSVDGTNLLIFNLIINNKSDTKITLKATLEIYYTKPDGEQTKAIVNHNPELKIDVPNNNLSAYTQEIRLEEKHTDSKWLFFTQPNEPFSNYRIDKYRIRVVDNKGHDAKAETYIIKKFN